METTTLDTIIGDRTVDLMKIDVEGFECDVIAGGPRVLANTRFVIAEAQSKEHLGNVTSALGSGWRRRKLGAGDHLFYRE